MSIVLVMIVRDEAHVIERCLRSVGPFVDSYVISDTGSTDDTRDVIHSVTDEWYRDGGVSGIIVEHAWVDFATNRNHVFDLARSLHGPDDYAFTIDADETLVATRPPVGLMHDGYMLPVEYGGSRYDRLALMRLGAPWRWVGPVHEYPEGGESIGRLTAPVVRVFHEGARSRDPDTYRKDAALLEAELERDPDNPRWQFYVAESYRFAGALDAALEAYEVRADNDAGWAQERWCAMFQIGGLLERRGADPREAWLRAFEFMPGRAEALVELARFERGLGRFALAHVYASAACSLPRPLDGLFVDDATYAWRCWDERAISAWWAGDREDALHAARVALEANPDEPRLAENLRQIEESQ